MIRFYHKLLYSEIQQSKALFIEWALDLPQKPGILLNVCAKCSAPMYAVCQKNSILHTKFKNYNNNFFLFLYFLIGQLHRNVLYYTVLKKLHAAAQSPVSFRLVYSQCLRGGLQLRHCLKSWLYLSGLTISN